MAHMAYPEFGSFESGGPCPATHPVRMGQLFYEVIWDTSKFNDKKDWPADGSQPFVWSFGDGYVDSGPFPCSYHYVSRRPADQGLTITNLCIQDWLCQSR